MSQILAKYCLRATLSDNSVDYELEPVCSHNYKARVHMVPISSTALFSFPERRLIRSMGRYSLLLSYCLNAIKDSFELGRFALDRIGVYLALDSGPVFDSALKELASVNSSDLAVEFKKLVPPKQHLKTNFGIGAAIIPILLKSQGPINTFYNLRTGVKEAFDFAEFDIQRGAIDLAVVASAFSGEDRLGCLRTSKKLGIATLKEGAGIVLMGASQNPINIWDELDVSSWEFGIASPLLNWITSGKINE